MPSRMGVGQAFSPVLGPGAARIGERFSTFSPSLRFASAVKAASRTRSLWTACRGQTQTSEIPAEQHLSRLFPPDGAESAGTP